MKGTAGAIGEGVFQAARVTASHPYARYASGANLATSCGSARQRSYGTGPPTPTPSGPTTATSLPKPVTLPSASTGSAQTAAPPANTAPVTAAPAVGMTPTELRDAVRRRAAKALTPYIADNWEAALRRAGLTSKYSHVPDGLRHGFNMGMPRIYNTQTPPNRPSLDEHMDHFSTILANEINKGRYIGPVTRETLEQVIGPFQTSPLSIIPKSTPGKFRPIQNGSFPISPSIEFPNLSINAQLDADTFPTTWGTFMNTALLIHHLPPGAQAATRDVKEAYRTIPIHVSQWPASVVRVGDVFFIDTAVSFGEAPASGIYGMVRNGAIDIMRSRGIGPISAWVDDHLFIRLLRQHVAAYNAWRQSCAERILIRGMMSKGGRSWYGGDVAEDGTREEFDEDCTFPCGALPVPPSSSAEDSTYTYSFQHIDEVSRELAIPWEPDKDQHFASTTVYIGFLWNLDAKTVQLGPEKTAKYLQAINDWFATKTHSGHQTESLYGKLLHACLVVPPGRAYLTVLESMLGTAARNPHLARHDDRHLEADLRWWMHRLENPARLTREIPHPLPLTDIAAFSDASTGFGIAVVIGRRWRAWRLLPGWKTQDGQREIGWAEAVGFELLARYVCASGRRARAFKVHGDNQGVVDGWSNGRSRNRQVNDVFKRIHTLLESLPENVAIVPIYVRSADNPADAPSRGIFSSRDLLLPQLPIPPELTHLIIDATTPLTPAERTAQAQPRAHPDGNARPPDPREIHRDDSRGRLGDSNREVEVWERRRRAPEDPPRGTPL